MLNSHDLIFFCIIVRTCMRVLIDSFTQLSCHIGPDLFLRLGSRLTLILLLELGRRLGELHFNNLVVNLVGFQIWVLMLQWNLTLIAPFSWLITTRYALNIWRVICLFSSRAIRTILWVCNFTVCVCSWSFWRFGYLLLKVGIACQTFLANARVYSRVHGLQTLRVDNLMDPLSTKHHWRMLLNLIVSSFENYLWLLLPDTRLHARLVVILSNHSDSSLNNILLLYRDLIMRFLMPCNACLRFISTSSRSLFKG